MEYTKAIRAEVAPSPGQPGWFQLTGKDITRWTMPAYDVANDLDYALNFDAKIRGIHDHGDFDTAVDNRFNEANNAENPQFFVYEDTHAGKRFMVMDVSQAEYALFRFLAPHESGQEYDEPLSMYQAA